MKKGFTLIELIAAIIILGIIGLITFPIVNSIIKENKESLYQSQIKDIEKAAYDWAYMNTDLLPENNKYITITLLDLKKAGLIDINLRNPKTNTLIPNDVIISITSVDNKYICNVDMSSGTDLETPYNALAPMIILNGNAVEYVEYGHAYEELGAIARGKNGNMINDINIVYQYNNSQIASIDTNQFKTYTVVYSARDVIDGNTYTSNITRTIIIRDTQAPEMTIPGQATITLSQVNSYDLTNGVVVTDNSNEVIEVNVTSLENTTGKQVITYSACDSHNNCVEKRRIINVTE